MAMTLEDIHAIAARAAETVLISASPRSQLPVAKILQIGYRVNLPDENIAWKILDREYQEMSFRDPTDYLAKFLGIGRASWDSLITEFRRRYGDVSGMWLTRTIADAKSWYAKYYGEHAPIFQAEYDPSNVVIDWGDQGAGIFVINPGAIQKIGAVEAPKTDEPPCPNLLPMAEWIKGDEPGTCRPCVLAPVVQWYYQELKEQGYEDLAGQLEAEVGVLDEDNAEQIMAICKDLDTIKAAVPEDLRKRLEEFDCALQVQDLDAIAAEVARAD